MNMLTKAVSIGIIGGADGPTAIFVTGPAPVLWLKILLAAAIAAIGILFLVCRNKKK